MSGYTLEVEDKRFKVKDPAKKIKTLLDKGKELIREEETLLERYQRQLLQSVDKTLLEKGVEIGQRKNTFKPKKKKKVIEEAIEVSIGDKNDDDDRYDKLIHFAKKYHIGLVGYNGKKTYQQLADEVYRYEMANKDRLIKEGIDKKYLSFGFFIKIV